MNYEIGREYDRLAITRRFGFSDDKQSMRGGLFFRDDTVILIKDEDGKQYEDRWDPNRPGTLLYYATLKSIPKNKGPEIRDLPLNNKANKAFKDGNYPIILFSKHGDAYRYMGEFERLDSDPIPIVKNGYYVPGFEVISKNPDLIVPYIDEYYDIRGSNSEWTSDEIESFSYMYEPEGLTSDVIHDIAICLNKSVKHIQDITVALSGGPSVNIPTNVLVKIREAIIRRQEEKSRDYPGHDVVTIAKTRVGQAIFRRNLDVMFGHKCCITGINQREVLVASHILPWNIADSRQKIDPNNGLLLNSFHDSLFDKYLMTVYKDGTIDYLDSLKGGLGSVYDKMCSPYSRIDLPGGYSPLKVAFDYHNRRFHMIEEIEGKS